MAGRLPSVISTLELVPDGWTFNQSRLLKTSELIRRASGRGFRLKSDHLRSLCQSGLLVPFFAIHDEHVGNPISIVCGPAHAAARYELDFAAADGRLSDPGVTPLPDEWRFDEAHLADEPRWWNGLLYSRWQLLEFAHLTSSFSMDGYPRIQGWRTDRWALKYADDARNLAILLTAVEARYYPLVDEGWVRPVNATQAEWSSYREKFNPSRLVAQLRWTGDLVVRQAENLLLRAEHIDPFGPWSRVTRHAPPRHQDKVKGLALLALDMRRAAEVLLLFAEDLGTQPPPHGQVVTAPIDGRLSRHGQLLEDALQSVGVSPHTRVALIVEGETEVFLARRILEHFGYGPNPDGLEVISMQGVGNKSRIQKLASHLATPIITGAHPDSYQTLRPLCQVIIATDPEGPMVEPERFREELVQYVLNGLATQGIKDVDPESVTSLISVETWSAAFEFAHFTDPELAQALLHLDHTIVPAGSTLDEATKYVAGIRTKRGNLKSSRLSKPKLAEQLWPVLRDKIDEASRTQSYLPAFADVVYSAHTNALVAMNQRWVLARVAPDGGQGPFDTGQQSNPASADSGS